MDSTIEKAVERAISTMRENLGEDLTVDDIAKAAMFSKFHFTRVFQRVTGLSPGRFLSALRLQRAKQLLVSTSLNVADISMKVGYNSVGTFSSRFSRSVGMPPTTYRRMSGYADTIATDTKVAATRPGTARMRAEARVLDGERLGLAFIGLFPQCIPEGQPCCCVVLDQPGPFEFDGVPQGVWYLLAQSTRFDDGTGDGTLYVGTQGPITVRAGTTLQTRVDLHPARSLDPPVLLALLNARAEALVVSGRQP
jgi:AraC family transcriptional regulator